MVDNNLKDIFTMTDRKEILRRLAFHERNGTLISELEKHHPKYVTNLGGHKEAMSLTLLDDLGITKL